MTTTPIADEPKIVYEDKPLTLKNPKGLQSPPRNVLVLGQLVPFIPPNVLGTSLVVCFFKETVIPNLFTKAQIENLDQEKENLRLEILAQKSGGTGDIEAITELFALDPLFNKCLEYMGELEQLNPQVQAAFYTRLFLTEECCKYLLPVAQASFPTLDVMTVSNAALIEILTHVISAALE
jgi:hypothetical protein